MTMKNQKNKYCKISSFEDFRSEREQLKFRSKLIEAKLSLNYLEVGRMFSLSNLFTSLVKDVVLPKISEFLGVLIDKIDVHVPSRI